MVKNEVVVSHDRIFMVTFRTLQYIFIVTFFKCRNKLTVVLHSICGNAD